MLIRIAAVVGVVGPVLLGGTIVGLTWLQRDFMRGLGWHPIAAPTLDWPSGLALGPYGLVMQAAFVGGGALLVVFAAGLQRGIAGGEHRAGPMLLAIAGGAMAMLAFKTDPTLARQPPTWHGRLHDTAFVLLGLSLFPAMLLLTRRFRCDPAWRGHAAYTAGTLLLAAPAFALKGIAFYVFLAAILLWIALTAARLGRNEDRQDDKMTR